MFTLHIDRAGKLRSNGLSVSRSLCLKVYCTKNVILYLCACVYVISWFFHFFYKFFEKKNLSEIQSECRTVWIQVRPDVFEGLTWILQTVCKGYQHLTLRDKGLNKTEISNNVAFWHLLTRTSLCSLLSNWCSVSSLTIIEYSSD